ncbi:uncharacterized protein LOC122510583 [Leptopilina heterotoma]|uniref:uncharacterized protein LOC122510583 n=1 Tax=Leptopilina heterotoma TaxID=63436 RepID=UPI001CA7FD5E|nr:uncharacterized protein LOC122510583 [Leptopilina heterotoma]
MLSTILCILVSVCAIFYFLNNRELYKRTNHIPGPFSLPLIGCAYKFIGDSTHFMTQIIRMSNIYKSPFRVIIGSRIFLFTKDPEQVKTILQSSKTIEKTDIYDFAKLWLGNGLVTAEHKIWRKHRKMIQPTFNKNILKTFISIFQKNSLLLTKTFEKELNGPEFEITPHVTLMAVSNICETSIGVSVETQKKEVEQFYIFSKRVFHVLFSRLIQIWLHPDFLFNLSSLAKSFNGYVTFIHNFIDEIIQKKREALKMKANINQGTIFTEDSLKGRKRTLDLLLELSDSESFTDKELREEVVTLITAGSDTTSRVISFVFLMLANYPAVQEKVYEEIFSVYGSDDSEKNPVKFEDLHNFMYLERVIMETMRIFPVVPLIGRLVLEDIELDGQTVPKGCSVVLFALGLHRNEKIWSDPLKFDPDRFLPEEVNKRHPCAFIPFSFGSKDCIDFIERMMKINYTYKSPFRMTMGTRVFIFTQEPEQIKTILQSSNTAEKDNIYNFAKPWVGDGLITAEQKIWRNHRKLIHPTFNKAILQSFVSIFQRNSLLLIKEFENKINGPEFEITPYVAFMSVSNICETSMGISVETQRKDVEKFYNFMDRAFHVLYKRLMQVWLHPDLLFNMSVNGKKFNSYITFMHNFTDEVIQKKRKSLQIKGNDIQEDSEKVRKPTLDFLLELSENEGLTDKELRDEVVTLICAGSDTTSKTVDFALFMLAIHPEIQEKVYEEIFSVYGSDDPEKNPVKHEDLHHFMYLERVIKETMRLFPITPLLARMVSDNIELDGKTVPKGCSAIISVLALHRNEKIWPDPLKFDPDRFLPEESIKRHPCAFIPFSFGLRNCIGRSYAMISIKVLLVTLLRKYVLIKDKITKVKDIKLKMDIILQFSKPIKLRIYKIAFKKIEFKRKMSTILYILVSILTTICAIFHFFKNRELVKKTNQFPGPFNLPLIGCAYKFIGDSTNFMKQIIKISSTYKSPFRLIFGSEIFIFTKNPEQIKTILQCSKAMGKAYVYDFAKPWLGDGLVTAEYEIWRKHRKIIQPTFNQKILQTFFSIFQKNSLLLIKELESKINGSEFEISPHIAFMAVSNICETSMDVSVETQKEDVEKMYNSAEGAFSCIQKRFQQLWLHSDLIFNMTFIAKKFNSYVKYTHYFTNDVIQKKKEALKLKANEKREEFPKEKKATLELLLELTDNECLSDKELRDEVITLVTAGSDTTNKTLDSVIYMLANNPEIQEKVYEEIFNVYGSNDPEINPVKFEDLQNFVYLERVMKETMRLFPIAPLLARKVTDDFEIDGKIVPKGCSAVILVIALHRDENVWPDPLKFDPDRFLPEEVKKRHPCAYIPFSYGPRDCIGRGYAMISMKVLLVTLLRKYILKVDKITKIEDIKLKMDTILQFSKPIKLRIEKR